MANGIIELTRFGNATNATLYGRMVWSSVSNGTAANTSTVTIQAQLKRPANSWTAGTWKGYITIGGNTAEFSQYLRVETEWITVATHTVTVSHNEDGTKSCYIDCKVNGPGATSMEGSYVTGSATVALDTIARYASLSAVTSFSDTGNPTITYSNPAGTSVTSLQACVSLNGASATTAYQNVPFTGTSFTLSLTEAERNTLRAATPNSNTLTVHVLLKTVIGSGSDVKSKSTVMNIVDADPTISATVVDTNSVTTGVTGNSSILVANQSTAKVTLTATAKKYASIVSRRIEHGATVLTANGSFAVTNNPIQFAVEDSRGNQTTQNATNTIVPYINPTCVIGNELPEADGSYTLSVTGLFYNGSIGKTTNALTVQYRYKAAGGSYPQTWSSIDAISKNGNNYSATANITGLDYQTVYTFQVKVVDAIHASGVIVERSVISQPVFDWGQYDFRFNVPVYDKTGAQIGNSETRWQNPPLILGTEYRTTEQWNGKPVYCKYINLGTLPNSTVKSINFTSEADSVVRPISVCGTYGTSESTQHMTLPSNSHNANLSYQVALTCVNYRQVRVITNFDASAFVGFATVKYWKTTD